MISNPSPRYLCRFAQPGNDHFVMIAEQEELPEIGEHSPIELRTGFAMTTKVLFYVTDIKCSDRYEDFMFADIEIHRA